MKRTNKYNNSFNVMRFCEVPDNSMFVILRERGRDNHAAGRWIKVGNSHSRRYHGTEEIILSLDDVVSIVPNNSH